jgi:hypothetical protein
MELNNATLANLGSQISAIERSSSGDMKKDVDSLGEQSGVGVMKDLIDLLGKDGKFDKQDLNILKLFVELMQQLEDKEGGAQDAMQKALEGGGMPIAAPATGGPSGSQAPPQGSVPTGSAPQTAAPNATAPGGEAGKSEAPKGESSTTPSSSEAPKSDSTQAASKETPVQGKSETSAENKAESQAECERCEAQEKAETAPESKPTSSKPEPQPLPAETERAPTPAETKPEYKPAVEPSKPEPTYSSRPTPVETDPEQTYNDLRDIAGGKNGVSSNEQKALDMFANAFGIKPKSPDDLTDVLRQMLKTALQDGNISENEARALSGIIGAMGGKASLREGELQSMLKDAFRGLDADGNISGQDLKTFGDMLSLVGAQRPGPQPSYPMAGNMPTYAQGMDYWSNDVLSRLTQGIPFDYFAGSPGMSSAMGGSTSLASIMDMMNMSTQIDESDEESGVV